MKRIIGMALACLMLMAWVAGAMAQEFLVGVEETAQSQPALSQPNPEDGANPLPRTGAAIGYQNALDMLDRGDLISAINAFARMGQYESAPQYTAYLEAKLHLLRNNPRKALEGFGKLGDFLDSRALAAQAQALHGHRFQREGLFGFVDGGGQVIIPPQFDWAQRSFRPESVTVAEGGQPSLPVAAVFMGATSWDGTDLAPGAGQYGLVRRDGTLAAPPAYDEILWTVDGIGALRSGEVFTLVDLATGQPLGEPYEGVGELSQGFIPVKSLGKWGYLRRDGAMLPGGFAWDSALPFREGMAGVSLEGKAGFIDTWGALTIPLAFDGVASFGEGMAGVRQGKKWGFVNPQGQLVIKPAFWEVGTFSQGRCLARRNTKWGVINAQGKWVISYKYDEITEYDPIYHRAWMRNNKLWGLLSLDGVVLKPAWATFTPFAADGMSAVSYKGRYGYIDIRGVNRIPNGFEQAAPFSAGVGGVYSGEGGTQYLNKLGRGFSLPSNVPTQPLNGFIEARKINEVLAVQTDPATGEITETVKYEIALSLYDVEGNPIEVR